VQGAAPPKSSTSWLRTIPGFRSRKPWLWALAGVGYLLFVFFLIAGVAADGFAGVVLVLGVLVIIWLAVNAWGIRRALPFINSPNKLLAAAAWAAFVLVWLVVIGVTAPATKPTQASTPSPPTTLAPSHSSTTKATTSPKPTQTPTPSPTPTPTPQPTTVATQPPPPPALTVAANIQRCVAAGNYETITIHTSAGASIDITVTYPSGSSNNGGTNNGSGSANSAGNFTDTWRVSGNADSGSASVDAMVSTSDGRTAETTGSFKIYHPNYGESC